MVVKPKLITHYYFSYCLIFVIIFDLSIIDEYKFQTLNYIFNLFKILRCVCFIFIKSILIYNNQLIYIFFSLVLINAI